MKEPDISLRAGEGVAAGFARITRELIACAIARVERTTSDRGEDVHAVRTVIKRLRGMLRLLGQAIFREKPRRFVGSLGERWSVWKKRE